MGSQESDGGGRSNFGRHTANELPLTIPKFFFFWVVPKWFSLLRTLSLSLSTSKFQRLVFSLTMKNIKRCFKVVKQYNLSNNPSSSLMTQIASQKKKKSKQNKI